MFVKASSSTILIPLRSAVSLILFAVIPFPDAVIIGTFDCKLYERATAQSTFFLSVFVIAPFYHKYKKKQVSKQIFNVFFM